MQIVYTPTKQDYRQLNSRALKQAFALRPLLWLPFLLSGALLSLSIGWLCVAPPFGAGNWNRGLLISGGIMIAWNGLMFCVFRFIGPQAYLRRPGALAARIVSLHPEGMLSDVQGMVTRVPWADVSEIAQERDSLDFSTGSAASFNRQIVFFVPTRAFASLTEAQAFLAEAKSLRSSATVEASQSWTTPVYDRERDMSVSYSLTMGELGWMPLQAMQKTFYQTYLTPLLMGGVFFAIQWFLLGRIIHLMVLPLAGISCVFGIIVSGMMQFIHRRGPQTMGPFARSMGDYRMTIAPQGFEQRSPSGLNWYPWPVITQITQKSDYVLFWTGRSPICMVPPGAFSSADDAQAFLKTAQDYHKSAQDGTPAPLPTRPTAWPPPPMR